MGLFYPTGGEIGTVDLKRRANRQVVEEAPCDHPHNSTSAPENRW